jgi:hypothetical protein
VGQTFLSAEYLSGAVVDVNCVEVAFTTTLTSEFEFRYAFVRRAEQEVQPFAPRKTRCGGLPIFLHRNVRQGQCDR